VLQQVHLFLADVDPAAVSELGSHAQRAVGVADPTGKDKRV